MRWCHLPPRCYLCSFARLGKFIFSACRYNTPLWVYLCLSLPPRLQRSLLHMHFSSAFTCVSLLTHVQQLFLPFSSPLTHSRCTHSSPRSIFFFSPLSFHLGHLLPDHKGCGAQVAPVAVNIVGGLHGKWIWREKNAVSSAERPSWPRLPAGELPSRLSSSICSW